MADDNARPKTITREEINARLDRALSDDPVPDDKPTLFDRFSRKAEEVFSSAIFVGFSFITFSLWLVYALANYDNPSAWEMVSPPADGLSLLTICVFGAAQYRSMKALQVKLDFLLAKPNEVAPKNVRLSEEWNADAQEEYRKGL